MKNVFGLLLIVIVMLLAGCTETLMRKNETYWDYFGTRVDVSVWVDKGFDTDQLFIEVDQHLKRVHQVSTKYDSYEGVVNVKTINEYPDVWHTVDPLLIDIIDLSVDYYNMSETKTSFNISLGKVFDVWRSYRDDCLEDDDCQVPELSELEAVATETNPNDIAIDYEHNAVKIPTGMALDLGGVAKGYGAKQIGDLLRDAGIAVFMVNAGTSNIEFYGLNQHPDRDFWSVGLKNPENPSASPNEAGAYYARIRVESGYNTVTSGDYEDERNYEIDGVLYHHIIDPNTFYPSQHIRATTVVTKDPAIGDILSTVIFVLPLEDAMALIDGMDDVEAIWFDKDGNIHMSEHFEEKHLITLWP